MRLTSTTPGSFTVTAGAADKTVTTGAPSFTQTLFAPVITVDKTTAVANGTAVVTYMVTLKDANNQPVAGETVKWSTTLGTLGTPSAATTNNSGYPF